MRVLLYMIAGAVGLAALGFVFNYAVIGDNVYDLNDPLPFGIRFFLNLLFGGLIGGVAGVGVRQMQNKQRKKAARTCFFGGLVPAVFIYAWLIAGRSDLSFTENLTVGTLIFFFPLFGLGALLLTGVVLYFTPLRAR